jgi:uncharacterized membrane protein YgaE (UPF0421/DUF939 family)
VSRPNRADVQVALLDSAVLAVACLASYWPTARLVTQVYAVSRADNLIGALWAVIATVFVFRDSYQRSVAAAASRIAATAVSFVLCLIYLAFLPFHLWALAVLTGVTALVVVLIGRPDDAITAVITTAVVMIASEVSPHHAWQQPVLRFADTVIGVPVGLAAAWTALRLLRPRLPRP